MNAPDDKLLTPIFLKTHPDMSWPQDKVFYLLTADGLHICRNSELFRSSVPARRYPGELATHVPFIELRCPRVPRRLLELAVGFFGRIAALHGAEAALLLAWDRADDAVHLLVPEQKTTVRRTIWGNTYPTDLHYEMPTQLPENWVVIGDLHSHVYGYAFSSYIDRRDEDYRPGLHIVVGRIDLEPPDFHVEAIVDGTRFDVDHDLALAGYHRRRLNFPEAWLDKVEVEVLAPYRYKSYEPRSHGAASKWDTQSDPSQQAQPRGQLTWSGDTSPDEGHGVDSVLVDVPDDGHQGETPPTDRRRDTPGKTLDIRQDDTVEFHREDRP